MTMQTITEQVEITPLNMDLDPCKPSEAFYQLEEYHTKTTKILTVGSIRKYKSRNSFEFNVGDKVEVKSVVHFSPSTYATRLIVNNWLKSVYTY